MRVDRVLRLLGGAPALQHDERQVALLAHDRECEHESVVTGVSATAHGVRIKAPFTTWNVDGITPTASSSTRGRIVRTCTAITRTGE